MLISHYGPDANNSVPCYVYDKIWIKHQLSLVTLSFPCVPYCAKTLSNSWWINWGPIGGFKVFGSGLESCSWKLCIRYFAPASLTELFYLDVCEPLRSRERQFRKQTLIHEVAMDVFLYSSKETRSHGLLQSKHRCSFGWNETGLPHQAFCTVACHNPSPLEHVRGSSLLCVEAQQSSYPVLGRNSQAVALFLPAFKVSNGTLKIWLGFV